MNTLSDTEWAVLEVLWGKNFFILGEVVDALKPATGWSRNTVHTYLTRMESKGLVTIDRSKDPHQYKAGVSHEECARKERRTAPVFSRCLQGILCQEGAQHPAQQGLWGRGRGSDRGLFKGIQDIPAGTRQAAEITG